MKVWVPDCVVITNLFGNETRRKEICPTITVVGLSGKTRNFHYVEWELLEVEEKSMKETKSAKNLLGAKMARDFAHVTAKTETEYQCPKCDYEWSGRSRSDGASARATLLAKRVVENQYACPKCRHEWNGRPKSKAASFGESSRERVVVLDAREKPPYRVPSMKEIAKIPPNGFKVASTFSGCGGSSLGYKMAGFRVVWASEFVPAAQETYRANFPKTILDERDIRTVKAIDILKATGLKKGELDVFDGSPPCASFSTAGKREKGWGEEKKYSDLRQRTDDLFFEYARLLRGLQPKVFVAENVSGLVKGSAKGYFKLILQELESCGYRVGVKVLDAQWLGVPQARSRTIFVGVREDLGLLPAHPSPLSYRYTIREALPWVKSTRFMLGTHSVNETWQDAGEVSSPCIKASPPSKGFSSGGGFIEVDRASLLGPAVGREWDKLEPGGQSEKYFSLVRPHLDEPCPTVTAIGGTPAAAVTHPTERRKFSIAELKRICAFPDDFQLTGSYAQQWERLGRAVPPIMMRAVATTILEEILRKVKK